MASPRKRRKASRTSAAPKRPASKRRAATATPKAKAIRKPGRSVSPGTAASTTPPRASKGVPSSTKGKAAKARPRAKAPGPKVTTRRRTKPTRTPKVSAGGGGKASRPKAKPQRVSTAKQPRARLKPARAETAKPGRTKPAKATPKRKLSRRPEAIKARRRRAELRAIEDAKAALRSERAKRAAETRKKKRAGSSYIPSERDTAIGWLEQLRNIAAHLYPVSLAITEAEASARTPWLVVGRFDFDQAVSYAELGDVIDAWDQDLVLTATINPHRLSQIRVIYNDPKDVRGASDQIVSKSGAWEYILSDLKNELIGFAPDDPDALAVRYESTAVQTIYVYFSSEIIGYRDAWRGPTQTVKLR